jgi:hypothetical protein
VILWCVLTASASGARAEAIGPEVDHRRSRLRTSGAMSVRERLRRWWKPADYDEERFGERDGHPLDARERDEERRYSIGDVRVGRGDLAGRPPARDHETGTGSL